jgi:glycosyltransferase involved in cell wall biosynthesis
MIDEQQLPAIQPDQSERHTPLLSVTVLNYNYAHYLPQCLDSILRQTWTDFELLLINDCSTDNSLEVIQPYLADPRVTLINHEQNQGYIASLIEGSDRSRGKHLTVISADDYCVSDRAFETLLGTLEADSEVAFAYSAFGTYDDAGTRRWIDRHRSEATLQSGADEYRDLVVQNHVLHSGTVIRNTAYKAVGGYDPKVHYACDVRMWLMLCGQGKVAYFAEELFAYRQHEMNMSESANGFLVGLREHIQAIDQTFGMMRDQFGSSIGSHGRIVERVIRNYIHGRLFGGRMRFAWLAFFCGVQLHPISTIFQRGTLTLIVCSVFGTRGYRQLRRVSHRPDLASNAAA